MNSQIKNLKHVPNEPLRIEREFENGREIIVIEGVRFDADYFRVFSHPETDVLYSVVRGDDDVVKLTVISNRVEAAEFFDVTFGADPDFTWEKVKEKYDPLRQPPSADAAFPQIEESDLGEENQIGDDDGI